MGRNYGQGAYGSGAKKPKASNRKFGKVVKYYFDNALAKNSNFLLFIIVIAFILGFLMTTVQYSLEMVDEESHFDDNWWNSVATVLKIQAKGDNWAARIVQFLFWSFSIMVSGFVIGFLTTKISSLTKNLNKGTSDVIKRNHILIIGWSPNVFAILKELNVANESNRNQVVVIFSQLGNEDMQDNLKSTMKSCKHLKIVTRHGDPTNPDNLKITNPNEARAIIILNNEEKNDARIVTSTLALCSILENKAMSIIVSIVHTRYAEAIKKIRNFDIIPIMADTVISNVTAQACRERGLGLVILDFLDFDGDELYYQNIPQLGGKTYGEALLSFDKSSVIGLVGAGGTLSMAPAADTVIKQDDQLIFVSEDDSTIIYQPIASELAALEPSITYVPKVTPNDMLYIGWSSTGFNMFHAMVGFLPKGSNIDIIYINGFVAESNLSEEVFKKFDNVTVTMTGLNEDDFDVEKILEQKDYGDVMILGYTDVLSAEEADTLTLLKALQLDSASESLNKDFRTITQLTNSSKAGLAKIGGEKELIVSDNLTALLMAQLVENPHLINVFNDLFESAGSSINIHDIDKYANMGEETTFAAIVQYATHYNESAIGLMMHSSEESDRSAGLMVNPSKSTKLTPKAGDRVIVVSHETDYL